MVEAGFVLGGCEAGLDGPAEPGDTGDFGKAHIGRREHDIVGPLFRVAQAAPDQEPMVERLPWFLERNRRMRAGRKCRGPVSSSPAASRCKLPGAIASAILAAARDCQEFRVRPVMMASKEIAHGPTQGSPHT